MLYVYRFFMTSTWGGCWFVVYIRRFIYKFLNVCPFDYTAVAGSGKVGPVNQVNHTSWVAIVIPTDRPKSVRNRRVIELFGGVVCDVTLPFWHFCWCRGLCQISYFFLLKYTCGKKETVVRKVYNSNYKLLISVEISTENILYRNILWSKYYAISRASHMSSLFSMVTAFDYSAAEP